MQQAFDTIAEDYDTSFTQTLIGTAQRNLVMNYLDNHLSINKKLNVLELNCGTGEDALWFAKRGHSVLATDISEEMLAITQKKINDAKLESRVHTLKLDISQIKNFSFKEKFDLVFSNFGGMNCLSPDEMTKLPSEIKKLLNTNGQLIMVLMPAFCIWETIYFLSKLQFRKAFRRIGKNGTIANMDRSQLKIFYYSPRKIKRIFESSFSTNALQPIGFFLPPSYLENFFKKKYKLFTRLIQFEHSISKQQYLSGLSDHFLIDLQLK